MKTQKDKLEELIIEADLSVYGSYRPSFEVYAKYLTDRGVIAPLCKVGDTVYYVDKYNMITTCFIVNAYIEYREKEENFFSWEAKFIRKKGCTTAGIFFEVKDINKTIFLTREEAEEEVRTNSIFNKL